MEEEQTLTFLVAHGKYELIIELFEYDTVELLKIEIHRKFQIPIHKQIIDGWGNAPETDNVILKMCVQEAITFLKIQSLDDISKQEDLELEAGFTFINKFPDLLPLTFHACKLSDAISTACLGPLKQRKVLLLYLHAKDDEFSLDLLAILRKPNVKKILQRSFFLLGWDIEDTKFHSALVEALNENELGMVINLVKSKINAVLCIVPIEQSVSICCCIRSNISEKYFIDKLTAVEKTVIDEVAEEEALSIIENQTCTNEDMDSERFQKMMADMLGDRDYDGFQFDQHDLLKDKIGYALFGPPKSAEGYDNKDKKRIDELFDIILRNSNTIAKYKDRVELSFIYNCLEPLPKEKIERAEKYPDYNPKTDLMPIPIFVLRKCRGSDDPCRLFIDDTGRVYETFEDYINSNKLHKGIMVLPSKGRYTVSDDERVQLERHPTPACGIDSMVLQGCDYASTAGGLLSGGVFVAAAIPAIPVAPLAVIGAGIVGLGVGVYSIGRSAFMLYDKHKHQQSLSFADSETRGAYLNIVAGSLGFVGAGANLVVSQLVTRGVTIGRGGAALVNTIGVANIGASGASLINSGIDVIDQWYNENQTPSLLTIVQLSSSVLFFGNAVYNFKTCATIVDETQSRVLQDYQESLRSNRHRKTFNKLMKATVSQNGGNEVVGKAEVIAAVRNIQNKDDVFAVLTRSNKDMNRNGIKFTASNGEIKLNGISIDMNEFASMSKRQANSFLSNLPTNVDVTAADTISMKQMLSLNNIPKLDTLGVLADATKLLIHYGLDVRRIIVELSGKLLFSLSPDIVKCLDKMFPNRTKFMGLLGVVMQFFGIIAEKIEEQYRNWKSTGDQIYYNPIFDHINVEKSIRLVRLFEYAVKCHNSPQRVMEDLLKYFHHWLANQLYESSKSEDCEEEQRKHSASSPALEVACPICKGYYYERK